MTPTPSETPSPPPGPAPSPPLAESDNGFARLAVLEQGFVVLQQTMTSIQVIMQPLLALAAVNAVNTPAASATATPAAATTSASPQTAAPGTRAACAKPDKFNGDNIKDLKPWISRSADIMRYAGIDLSTTYCIAYIIQFLGGNARNIWDRLVESSGDPYGGYRNWAEFCAGMKSYLADPHPDTTARNKIRNLRQTGSVQRYSDAYLALAAEIPGRTDADLRADFIHGLKDKIREWVMQVNPATFDDARRVAHEADSTTYRPSSHTRRSDPMELGTITPSTLTSALTAALSNLNIGSHAPTSRGRPYRRSATPSRSSRTSSRSGPSSPHRSRSPAVRHVRLNQLSAAERQKLFDNNQCFYCREVGHAVADCPKKAIKDGKQKVRFTKNK